MDDTTSVLIASRNKEDQERILAALPENMGFFIASTEKDETGAIIRTERLKPDVLILDLQLTGAACSDLVRILLGRSPSTAIILLCNDEVEDEFAIQTLNTGISGFLLKNKDFDKLAYITKIAALGGRYVNDSILLRTLNNAEYSNLFPGQIKKQNCISFSPTERAVVTQMAQGYSDTEIAENLNFHEGSVKNCLTAFKQKTKMKSRSQIVAYSLVYGLIKFDNLKFILPDNEEK